MVGKMTHWNHMIAMFLHGPKTCNKSVVEVIGLHPTKWFFDDPPLSTPTRTVNCEQVWQMDKWNAQESF
jgi:hypothetical protein